MRRIIFKTTQSPGDVVMLTAAVREWKWVLGAGVEIGVRTPCPALWAHNPQLTPLADGAGELSATSCPKWGFAHASLSGEAVLRGPGRRATQRSRRLPRHAMDPNKCVPKAPLSARGKGFIRPLFLLACGVKPTNLNP